jgi:hypothetical protein
LLAGATLALLTAVNFSPAMAQEPKPSGGNTWAGVSQRVDTSSANATATAARYEYQYGYNKHAAWRATGSWSASRRLIQKASMSLQVPAGARRAHRAYEG